MQPANDGFRITRDQMILSNTGAARQPVRSMDVLELTEHTEMPASQPPRHHRARMFGRADEAAGSSG
ncbi:hypothetical protein [Tropicimonas aquimaris]|uniref:Uncharacterized protein n=1 Tax=Tropicimonas aquimaris TaxID=914152 RepID=A0ABW3ILI6_9RHOB